MMRTLTIGIAGGSGSGKSTLTRSLAAEFGDAVLVINHDDYYKSQDGVSFEERCRCNYDHPNAFDTDLLIGHLKALKEGRPAIAPTYDFTQHNRAAAVRELIPAPVILVDGILILECEELRALFDLKIFVDADADVRVLRRILRDVKERGRSLDSVIGQYLNTVKPMHEAFVEPSKRYADLIVPEGGLNTVAREVLESRIRKHLETED